MITIIGTILNKQRSSEDERIILGNSDIGIHPLHKS
jgi:hypothetical protein